MTRSMFFSAALAVAIATPALAQDQSGAVAQRAPIIESLTDLAKEPAPKVEEFFAGQVPGELLATDLIGLTVHDTGAAALGVIDDVLFDENGKPTVVVVDVGKYLGSDKRVAFALENLRYTMAADDVRLVASIDQEALKAAPTFTSLADEMALDDAQKIFKESSYKPN